MNNFLMAFWFVFVCSSADKRLSYLAVCLLNVVHPHSVPQQILYEPVGAGVYDFVTVENLEHLKTVT